MIPDDRLLRGYWERSEELCFRIGAGALIQIPNPRLIQTTGMECQELTDLPFRQLFAHTDEADALRQIVDTLRTTDASAEIRADLLTKQGKTIPITWKLFSCGEHVCFLGSERRDTSYCERKLALCEKRLERLHKERITRLEARNKALNTLSVTDHLTGVHNRRYLDEWLGRFLDDRRRDGEEVSILMCDIDCFKRYNDTYGHPAGDRILKKVADVFRRCLQRSDDIIVRYGGEEFLIILPDTSNPGAIQVAKGILDALAAEAIPHDGSDIDRFLTMSIGIATAGTAELRDYRILVELADRQLYRAKLYGKNMIISAHYDHLRA